MFELLGEFLLALAGLFVDAYQADHRPEALRYSIGCGLVVFAAVGAFLCWWIWQ